MTRKSISIIVLAMFLLFDSCGTVLAWEGVVMRIQDGDSFQVRREHRTESIRLYGIDCPEYQQPGGKQAKKLTSSLVKGHRGDILPMDTDRYGRTVAIVRVGGLVLNAELVRTGWAWVYPRYCTAQALCRQWQSLEQEARRSRLGIWQDAHPEPPWQAKSRRGN